MEANYKKKARLVKFIDFGEGIFGRIYIKYDSIMHSTHSYFEREFRCYVCSSSVNHYLTSFDTIRKARIYLLNLHKHRHRG